MLPMCLIIALALGQCGDMVVMETRSAGVKERMRVRRKHARDKFVPNGLAGRAAEYVAFDALPEANPGRRDVRERAAGDQEPPPPSPPHAAGPREGGRRAPAPLEPTP